MAKSVATEVELVQVSHWLEFGQNYAADVFDGETVGFRAMVTYRKERYMAEGNLKRRRYTEWAAHSQGAIVGDWSGWWLYLDRCNRWAEGDEHYGSGAPASETGKDAIREAVEPVVLAWVQGPQFGPSRCEAAAFALVQDIRQESYSTTRQRRRLEINRGDLSASGRELVADLLASLARWLVERERASSILEEQRAEWQKNPQPSTLEGAERAARLAQVAHDATPEGVEVGG